MQREQRRRRADLHRLLTGLPGKWAGGQMKWGESEVGWVGLVKSA